MSTKVANKPLTRERTRENQQTTRGDITARRDEAVVSAQRYQNRSRADSTWRAYENDWKQFCDWCESVEHPALPASPDTVAGFISIEADKDRAISTIRRRLAAIRLMHIAQNLPSPHETLQVNEVLKGIANAQRNRPLNQAKPALEVDIRSLVSAIDTDTTTGKRDRALLLVGFDAALRRSELVAIQVEHIERRNAGLVITIPHSKTDPTGKGSSVAVLERPGSPYCPVRAIESWLSISQINTGPIFRRIYKGKSKALGAAALSDRSVSLILKRVAKKAGYSSNDINDFSGHSLRRGFITSAAFKGQGIIPIMKQSRHKHATSVIGYVETADLLDTHPGIDLLQTS